MVDSIANVTCLTGTVCFKKLRDWQRREKIFFIFDLLTNFGFDNPGVQRLTKIYIENVYWKLQPWQDQSSQHVFWTAKAGVLLNQKK